MTRLHPTNGRPVTVTKHAVQHRYTVTVPQYNTCEESHELSEFDPDIFATLLDNISIYFFYQEIMICHIKALFPLQTRCLSGDDVFLT